MTMRAGDALGEISVTTRAKPILSSQFNTGMTKSEAHAWDTVQAYMLANPNARLNEALNKLDIAASNYYKAKKKAITNVPFSMGNDRHGQPGIMADAIRPEDAIVKNNTGLGRAGLRPSQIARQFAALDGDISCDELSVDPPPPIAREMTRVSSSLVKTTACDVEKAEVRPAIRITPAEREAIEAPIEPEAEAEPMSDRDALNEVIAALEGFEPEVQRRILRTASVWVGLEN